MKVWMMLGLLVVGAGYVAKDYVMAGYEDLIGWVKGGIPVGMQIEVMEEAIRQLDQEVQANSRKVVEESVALDRFAEQVDGKAASLARMKSGLAVLKVQYNRDSCGETKGALEGAMVSQVTRFKAQHDTWKSMSEALASKRDALTKMQQSLDQQKLTRETLTAKLEGLRAEYESMRMRGQLSDKVLESSASHKATSLYAEIRDRLEIERRLWEQQASTDLAEPELPIEVEETAFDIASVDAIIGQLDELASR